MDYKLKYLKYKKKYLDLKNIKGAGFTDLLAIILSDTDISVPEEHKKFLQLVSQNDETVDWSLMPELNITISPEVKLLMSQICAKIKNGENKLKCKKYYNMLVLLHLVNKYIEGGYTGQIINIEMLNNILLKTIPLLNLEDKKKREFEQSTLIQMGANLKTLPIDFRDNGLLGIVLPSTLTEISSDAFANNLIRTIIIPKGVKIIRDGAFFHNIEYSSDSDNFVETVIIPNTVTHIGTFAFSENNLQSIVIPNSVTHIRSSAFADNKLKSLLIPQSVIEIGDSAFSSNPLTHVTIPSRFKSQVETIFGPDSAKINFTFI